MPQAAGHWRDAWLSTAQQWSPVRKTSASDSASPAAGQSSWVSSPRAGARFSRREGRSRPRRSGTAPRIDCCSPDGPRSLCLFAPERRSKHRPWRRRSGQRPPPSCGCRTTSTGSPARWAKSRTVPGRRAGSVGFSCGGMSRCRSHQIGTAEGSLCACQTSNLMIHRLWKEDRFTSATVNFQSTVLQLTSDYYLSCLGAFQHQLPLQNPVRNGPYSETEHIQIVK